MYSMSKCVKNNNWSYRFNLKFNARHTKEKIKFRFTKQVQILRTKK